MVEFRYDSKTAFEYSVIRSSRHSFSVTVKSDNSIVVRCPSRASQSQIIAFIKDKSEWILRTLAVNSSKISRFSDVLSLKKIPVKGEFLPVTFGGRDYICPDGAYFKNKSHIKNVLIRTLRDEFFAVYEAVCRQTSLSASSVAFRDYKARWGCCDANAKIVFNYKLLMLDESLWRYVILHELCHTVYMNHSVRFYDLMGKFMPTYKEERKRLKDYSVIASLSL